MSKDYALVKSMAIESAVRRYFRLYAEETYGGSVTTDEVMDAARKTIHYLKRKFTIGNEGETYDLISELGPVGEADDRWLAVWGKHLASEESGKCA